MAASGSGVNTAPTVTTGAASAITTNSATVAGTLNTATSCGTVTAYGIEYSTTTGFTPGTGTQVASSNLSGTAFSSALTGLSSCTVYYTRAYATRASGTTYGAEGSFTTAAIAAPTATAGTSVTDAAFTANWGAVTGAVSYRLDVSTSPTFSATGPATTLEEFTGGTTPPAGWNFTSIGGTYTSSGNYGLSSPSLQLNATNDQVTTPVLAAAASDLSFWIEGKARILPALCWWKGMMVLLGTPSIILFLCLYRYHSELSWTYREWLCSISIHLFEICWKSSL